MLRQNAPFISAHIAVEKAELPHSIEISIMNELINEYGDQWSKMHFAVRSSAVGEDGAAFSSAGQMETVLNVSGTDEVCR